MENLQKPLAVVLLSGGLDSCTSLYWALKAGYSCYTLGFDYGQLQQIELEYAQEVAFDLGLPWRLIHIDFSYLAALQLDPSLPLPPQMNARQISRNQTPSPFTIPGRNTIFFAHAMSLAATLGAKHIVLGFSKDDHAFCDCSRPFTRMLEQLSSVAIDCGPLQIHTPLLNLRKPEIIQLACELKVPLQSTWSRYRPNDKKPCGQCPACILRRDAFAQLHKQDPARRSRQEARVAE